MTVATQTSVEEADTGLSELLNRVERGEEITITRARTSGCARSCSAANAG